MKFIKFAIIFILIFSTKGNSVAETGHLKDVEIFVYDSHDKRDPMWPLVSTEGVIINYDNNLLISDLSLEGIMLGEGNDGLAIINGRVVKINDDIGDFIIVGIELDKVFLLRGQKKFELKLKKEE